MANEPITLYSSRNDLVGVAKVLKRLAGTVEVVGPSSYWEKAVVTGKKRWFRKVPKLTFFHEPDLYEGSHGVQHRAELMALISSFPDVPRKRKILEAVGNIRFVLTTEFEPDFDPAGDERLNYLYAVAKHLGGMMFTPSSLRDWEGRILIAEDGEHESDAELPRTNVTLMASRRDLYGDEEDGAEAPVEPMAKTRRTHGQKTILPQRLLPREAELGQQQPERPASAKPGGPKPGGSKAAAANRPPSLSMLADAEEMAPASGPASRGARPGTTTKPPAQTPPKVEKERPEPKPARAEETPPPSRAEAPAHAPESTSRPRDSAAGTGPPSDSSLSSPLSSFEDEPLEDAPPPPRKPTVAQHELVPTLFDIPEEKRREPPPPPEDSLGGLADLEPEAAVEPEPPVADFSPEAEEPIEAEEASDLEDVVEADLYRTSEMPAQPRAGQVVTAEAEEDLYATEEMAAQTPAGRLDDDADDFSQAGAVETQEQPPLVRPDARRVARRALVLAAVAGRGLLEQQNRGNPDLEAQRQRLLQWLEDLGVDDELEQGERSLLHAPKGMLKPAVASAAAGRAEALVVLAWALGLSAIPPHDRLVDPGQVLPAFGFLNQSVAQAFLDSAQLRPEDQINGLAHHMFALHWRLAEFKQQPEHLDFAAYARTTWFGPLDEATIQLIDGDLALGNQTLSAAPDDKVSTFLAVAEERHRAANWLCGFSDVYSTTDITT